MGWRWPTRRHAGWRRVMSRRRFCRRKAGPAERYRVVPLWWWRSQFRAGCVRRGHARIRHVVATFFLIRRSVLDLLDPRSLNTRNYLRVSLHGHQWWTDGWPQLSHRRSRLAGRYRVVPLRRRRRQPRAGGARHARGILRHVVATFHIRLYSAPCWTSCLHDLSRRTGLLFFSEERTRETFSFASIEGLRRGRRGGCVGGARRGEGRGVCHRAGWNSGAVGKDQGAGRRRALSPPSVGPSLRSRPHSRRWACDRARAAAGPLRWGRVPAGLMGPTGLLGLCGSVRVRPLERSVTI